LAEGSVFLRTASGLSREIGVLGAFSICILVVSLSWMEIPLVWPSSAPGGVIYVTLFIALILYVWIAITYVLCSSAIPRSGGDYVWVSRLIHPSVGFTESFVYNIFLLMLLGMVVRWAGTLIGSLVYEFGYTLQNPTLLGIGEYYSTNVYGIFIMCTIFIVYSIGVLALGVRFTARWCAAVWIVSLIGFIPVVLLLAYTPSNFITAWNARFGSIMDYNAVIATAKQAGYSWPGFTWAGTIAALPLAYWTLSGWWYAGYFSGEIKSVKKTLIIAILGSLLLAVIVHSLSMTTITRTIPYDFLGAIGFLFYIRPDLYTLPVPPFAPTLISLLIPSAAVSTLGFIGLTCTYLGWMPSNFLAISRNIFAWSFDRVVPVRFSDVSPRFRVPVWSAILTGAICELGLIMTIALPGLLALFNFLWAASITALLAGVSAILLPFRQRQAYESSPLKFKIGPLPFMSICGCLTVIISAWLMYSLQTNPVGGSPLNAEGLMGLAFTIVFGFVIYYVARAYHKARGIDIEAAFKEIPPE
jgi:APA family basic amino acid/polyamine antiporter